MTALEGPVIVDADLMEIGMGSAEGMTQVEVEQRWPVPKPIAESEAMWLQSPDGEDLLVLAKRLERALSRVAGHHAVSRIVVSHGVAGRVLRALYLGLSAVEALRLEAPQDALFHLSGGEITRISC